MMERVGAKNSNASSIFSFSERTLLNGILKAFVCGISDSEVRKEAARGLASSEASLKSLYLAVESGNRAQQEIRKLEVEDARVQELQYYRILAREKAQPVQHNSSDRETQPTVRNQPRDLGYGNKLKSPVTNTHPPPSKQPFELPANLPDRTTLRNSYINGTWIWIYKQVGSLYVNCGQCGHTSKACSEPQLPAWERSYLKEIVFGDPPRSMFASYGAGYFDGDTLPFGFLVASQNSYQNPLGEPLQYQANITNRANSVSAGVCFTTPIQDLPITEVMYGESSGPNMCPHIEDTSARTTGRTQGRHKKSGKRGEQKQTEVLPLVGMLNETTRVHEKPVSIRELLKSIKVDVSLLDLVAWSPTSYKEVKRLCTYVTKKKKPIVQESQKTTPMSAPFNPQYPKATLPGFHTMFLSVFQQPVPTSSRPMQTQTNLGQQHFGNAASHAPPQHFYQQNIPPQNFRSPVRSIISAKSPPSATLSSS